MLWAYGIISGFIFLAVVLLVRFLVGMKEKSRVSTGTPSAAGTGAAPLAQQPPWWGMERLGRTLSELLMLTVPIWAYTILWLLLPEVFGPVYEKYSRWLWVACIVVMIGLWSFRSTAPLMRKSRMVFYIFLGILIVAWWYWPSADSPFKSEVVEKQMAELHVPFKYTFLGLDEEKKVIPPNDGGYSDGVCVSKEGTVILAILNPVCDSVHGVVVHFYNKAGTHLRSETLTPQSAFSLEFDCVRFTRPKPSSGYCPVNVWVRDVDARP